MVYKGVKCPDCNIGPVVEYGLDKARCENCGRVIDLSKIDPRVRPEPAQGPKGEELQGAMEAREKTFTEAKDQEPDDGEIMLPDMRFRADYERGTHWIADALMDYMSGKAGQIDRLTVVGFYDGAIKNVEGEGGDGN